MNTAKGRCKVCGQTFTVAETAHVAFRDYCPSHWMDMLEDHDKEVLE